MKRWQTSRTTDSQWKHKSKKSENLGQCGRQSMLRLYLKIWFWAFQWGQFPHRASVVRGRHYYLITVFKDLCFGLLYLKRLVIFCLHSSLSISVFLLPMLCQLFHFAGSFVSKVYCGQLWQKFGDRSNIHFFKFQVRILWIWPHSTLKSEIVKL